ncbi:hypothetical protein KKC88_04880 [Patescibacteria group bacterium]|nr:hypothetical protein [Patescibacteria group bacterium]MBU1673235.1 hypothetical protein [Patescibacteria group bacterium]MBU1964007.1 hypothetical protein [Patescibacteria group bacterium]
MNKAFRIILLILIPCVGLFSILSFSINPDKNIFSRDALAHSAEIKFISETGNYDIDKRILWEEQNKYPPMIYMIGIGVLQITGISDFYILSLVINSIFYILLLLLFYILAKKVFKNEDAALLSVLILSISNFIIYRFTLMLPENFAIILMLLFFIIFISDKMPIKLRIILCSFILAVIGITNILTFFVVAAGLILYIPVKIWEKKYINVLGLGSILLVSVVVNIVYRLLNGFNLWMISLLLIPFIFAVLTSGLAFLGGKIKRKTLYQILGIAGIVILLGIILVITFNEPFIINNLSDTHVDPTYYKEHIVNNIRLFFFGTSDNHINMNGVISIVVLLGIFFMFVKRKYDLAIFLIILSIGWVTMIFAPLFGLDPLQNTPRAMMYISIFAALFAAYGLVNFNSKKLAITALFFIMVTSIPNAVVASSYNSSFFVPKVIKDYLAIRINDQLILTDDVTAKSLYISGPDFNHIINTPAVKKDDLQDMNIDFFKENNINFIITSPIYKGGGYKNLLEKYFNAVLEEDGYILYMINN